MEYAEMVDAIDGEVTAWYDATGCELAKDEAADEKINLALGSDPSGLGLANGTSLDRAEIAEAVQGALQDWWMEERARAQELALCEADERGELVHGDE